MQNMTLFTNTNIVLGITGGIAAYKTPDLVRKLRAQGANVRVVLTQGGKEFVSALSLQAVSGNPVAESLLDPAAEAAMGHIELAKWADVILIAPATAQLMAKLTAGMADDLLTTLCLASTAPVVLAPAMNQQMWAATATQDNLNALQARPAVHFIGPAAGEQACGDIGLGRMVEPEQIVNCLSPIINSSVSQETVFKGVNITITAGPTREAIDPVRYISNHSSGKMGYALAEAARNLGANVTLISGPVNLSVPQNVDVTSVESAEQMLGCVLNNVKDCDIFIACAAVADYRPAMVETQKIKKNNQEMALTFIKNPDILGQVAALSEAPFTVGFAAETEHLAVHAQQKLTRKNINMIAANDVSNKDIGFNSEQNALQVFWRDDNTLLPMTDKRTLARQLLKLIHQHYSRNTDAN